MKKIYLILSFAVVCIASFAQQTFTTFQNAAYTIPASSASAVAISPTGQLAVANQGGLVYLWNSLPVTGAEPSDVTLNTGSTNGIAFSPDGKLIATETGSGSVAIWNTFPTVNGQSPSVTLSVPGPLGVVVSPSGKLIVSDYGNNSLYIWNSVPTVSNQAPDLIYGSGGTSNNQFSFPWGLSIAPNGNLYVADFSNNRVLIFNEVPTSSGAVATRVIGQADFTSNGGAVSSTGLSGPIGVTVTSSGQIAISEFYDHRALVYNQKPSSNGAAADVVLGQPNFSSGVAYAPSGTPALNNMRTPYAIASDLNGRLFVAGRDMSRVMVFGVLPSSTADLSINVVLAGTPPISVCDGSQQPYQVVVTNSGPDAASSILVNSQLPAGFTYNSSSASTGSYNSNSGLWTLGNLSSGAQATLTITGTAVNPSGTIPITANITNSSALDNNLANNTDTEEIFGDTAGGIVASVVVVGGAEFCDGSQNKLRTALTYSSYQWYRDNQLIPGATTKSITNTDGGEFYAFVMSDNGCQGYSDTVTITVNPLPAVEFNVPNINEFCEPATLPLIAANTPNATYQWFRNGSVLPGEVTNSYTVSTTGLYQLSALSDLGCQALSDNILVSVKPAPVVPTISNSEPNILTSSSAENNQWYKNGVLISGATNQALSISENAVYSVLVTNPNGCTRESQAFAVNNVGILSASGQYNTWSTYPNPFIDKVLIEASESASYQLFDVNGKVVAAGAFKTGSNELNLGGLSKGMYHLQANTSSQPIMIRLIKE